MIAAGLTGGIDRQYELCRLAGLVDRAERGEAPSRSSGYELVIPSRGDAFVADEPHQEVDVLRGDRHQRTVGDRSSSGAVALAGSRRRPEGGRAEDLHAAVFFGRSLHAGEVDRSVDALV